MSDNFQANLKVTKLYGKNNAPPQTITCGIVPFVTDPVTGDTEFLVMKPQPKTDGMGDPGFQLPKGTRRVNIDGQWFDLKSDEILSSLPFAADKTALESLLQKHPEAIPETPLETALREGHEEVGLRQSNIKKIYDMGGFVISSASTGASKPLHMFAAEVADKNDFDKPESSTAQVQWMKEPEFEREGRADHVAILGEIANRLSGRALVPARE